MKGQEEQRKAPRRLTEAMVKEGNNRMTHLTNSLYTDIPLARFTGSPIYHSFLVPVVEVFSLGNTVQLTFIGCWQERKNKHYIPQLANTSGAWYYITRAETEGWTNIK